MKEKTVKLLVFGLVFVQAIGLFVSYFYLPDLLVMQVNLEGNASTTLPKYIGLPLFFLIVGLVNVRGLSNKEKGVNYQLIIVNIFLMVIEIIIITWNL